MDETSQRSQLMQEFLAGRDFECPACRYNLRNLQNDRCPECGEQLVLRLSSAEPRQGACIAGLVGLASGAGFSGLLLLYFLLMIFVVDRGMPPNRAMVYLAIMFSGLLIEGGLLLFWIKHWYRIRRLGGGWRAALVAGCYGVSLANLLIFTASVR